MGNLFKRRLDPKLWTAALFLCLFPDYSWASEGPFFITYTHQMEEPGNLEMSSKAVTGVPDGGNRFLANALEFEYGVRGWWTMEVYLDGQTTARESTIFTGYRLENRFRILPREHWMNPVLYVEFENISGADKTLLEVVGHDSVADLTVPNDEARREKQREIETKLILSSYYKGWTIAENFIAEKNLQHEPYEFGYAAGVSRPFSLAARPEQCELCPENFQAGVEIYGGLGTYTELGLRKTSHYVGPTLAWTSAGGVVFRIAPSFGVTGTSASYLLRFSVTYEVAQVGRVARRMFHGRGSSP